MCTNSAGDHDAIHSYLLPATRKPRNKGKLVGQKSPFKLNDIWAIRVRLQLADRTRELALLNLALDSKLRGGDLVRLRVQDVCHGERVANRAIACSDSPVANAPTSRPYRLRCSKSSSGTSSATPPALASELRCCIHRLNPQSIADIQT